MTARHAVAIASGILLMSAGIGAADDRQASPTAGAMVPGQSPALFEQRAAKNPYEKLFAGAQATPPQRPLAQPIEATRPEKPKVVCGMLLIPADASIDPRMRVSPSANDNTKHTMRVVKPPMCTSE